MTLLLLKDTPGRGDSDPAQRPGTGHTERRRLRCRVCEVEVADPADRLDLTHGPEVFVNPAGFAHEVLTFAAATNVFPFGAPTGEFSWFAGYTWRHLLCAGCHHHLGWQYDAAGDRSPSTFYGFRRAEVV